tara:strand:- start:90 stop:290 length:201 start_codon:yes stop_codon:yes gene_type:complete
MLRKSKISKAELVKRRKAEIQREVERLAWQMVAAIEDCGTEEMGIMIWPYEVTCMRGFTTVRVIIE